MREEDSDCVGVPDKLGVADEVCDTLAVDDWLADAVSFWLGVVDAEAVLDSDAVVERVASWDPLAVAD